MDKFLPFLLWPRNQSYAKLWLWIFLITACAALMIQLVILPYLLPHLHAGHGLLVGGDSVGFHNEAVFMADRILHEGWSAWELRPHNNAPIGIAAFAYVFTVPEPYVLIPLNAALHATAGITLMLITTELLGDKVYGFWGSMPLLFYPSAAAWYSQIHKDGFFVAGILLCLYGWITLMNTNERNGKSVGKGLAFFLGGIFLIWIVRSYLVELMQVLSFVIAIGVSGWLLVIARQKKISVSSAAPRVFAFFAIPFILIPFNVGVDSMIADVSSRDTIHSGVLSIKRGELGTIGVGGRAWERWVRTEWLPAKVDNAFFGLANARDGLVFGYQSAASTIDKDFVPSRFMDFVKYSPRALQIGFLAPFPIHWIGRGSIEAGTVMRRVVSVEMIGIYLSLLCLPLVFKLLGRNPRFWVVFSFCFVFILIDAYVLPNLGTLHRMRYGFIMTIVALCMGSAMKSALVKTQVVRTL